MIDLYSEVSVTYKLWKLILPCNAVAELNTSLVGPSRAMGPTRVNEKVITNGSRAGWYPTVDAPSLSQDEAGLWQHDTHPVNL